MELSSVRKVPPRCSPWVFADKPLLGRHGTGQKPLWEQYGTYPSRTAPAQASPGARVAVQPVAQCISWNSGHVRLDVESGRWGGACRHLERADFRLRDAEVYDGEIKGTSTFRRRVRKRSTADGWAGKYRGKYRATQIRGKIEYPVTILIAPTSASCLRQDPSGNADLRLFRATFFSRNLPFRTPPRLRFIKPKTTL